jgi:RNA polymerase sigma-70 factor (ECF subfamily)
LSAIWGTTSIARSPPPFRVALERPSVRQWKVSSEPALQRPPPSGAEETSDSLVRPRLGPTQPDEAPARPATSQHAEPPSLRFEDVFRRYAPYVGALVLRLIGRPGDVDDVVQDVFLQAHRGLGKLRDPAAVQPWLRRITVRRSRRWLRRRWALRWLTETDIDGEKNLADASASPEERATIAYVYRTLEKMPRDERLVWVLRFVEGETLESIADLLGASVSTVQRRLRAAQATMGDVR